MPEEQPDTVAHGTPPAEEASASLPVEQYNEPQLLYAELMRENLALRSANDALRLTVEQQIAFVSMAVHELRNPLNPIAGYIEMLLEGMYGQLDAGQQEPLMLLQRNVQRLEIITGDLLDVVQIEAGRLELALWPVDLSMLIQLVAATYRRQAEERSLQLSISAPAGLPMALCDESRMIQILRALVSNASMNTPGGGHISVAVTRSPEEGFLSVAVTSNGGGEMAPQQDNTLAQPFADAWVKGIGFHAAKLLIELHGGRIWLERGADGGATFCATVPIAR